MEKLPHLVCPPVTGVYRRDELGLGGVKKAKSSTSARVRGKRANDYE